jgi:hypothetical protein
MMKNSFLPDNEKVKLSRWKVTFFLLVYVVSVYVFSFYINANGCNTSFLPDWLSKVLEILNESIFAFMDRHNSYASRVECFKSVVSFGFLLIPLSLAFNLFLHHKFFINQAIINIRQKNFKMSIFGLIVTIAMVYLYFFTMDYNGGTSRYLIRRLYQNIDLWSSQAFRTILCSLAISYVLLDIYAYSYVVLEKIRGKQHV